MNNVLRKIEIDLYSPTSYEVIKAQQGDKNSRIIEFVLYDQGNPYEISDNVFFRFDGHRGDGSSFSKTEEQCIVRDGNHISVTLQEDILYYAGTIEAKLVMYELGNTSNKSSESETNNKLQEKPERTVLSTIPFKISCIKNPCNENNLSNGELSIITDLIFQMEQFSKNAQDVIDQAQESADKAKDSETNAKASEDAAKISETNAANSASTAMGKANDATNSANTASSKADEASNYAKQAQSYALGTGNVRPDESINSAKYYYEQAREISSSFKGALRPMGTVTFANLPELANAGEGDMYNISDQFTTNANFKEGSGFAIPAGSNVYKTADDKWDILAGSPVTGVKGNKETNYRNGNITLTPDNIGAAPVDIIENGNFNDMIKSGFYTMRSPVSHKPPSSYSCFGLFVFCSDEGGGLNYVTQIAKDDNNIYIRKGHGYEYSLLGFEWEEWRKVGDSSGKTGYISYPSDAYYQANQSNVSGYIKITLPVSWTNTFIKFTVSIYTMGNNESCDYHISGYNYAATPTWSNCTAICTGKPGAVHTNLSVRFGHDGSKCAICIGEIGTRWDYPVVQVHDVMLGYYKNDYETWESGWNVSIGTSLPATINTTVQNTNVAYGGVAGSCNGNSASATKATQDGNGNNIANTYAKKNETAYWDTITSGSFNDVERPGIYTMSNVSTNAPNTSDTYWGLIVLTSTANNINYVEQIAVREATTEVYVRYKGGSDSNWGDWRRLVTEPELSSYQKKAFKTQTSSAGGSITFNTYYYNDCTEIHVSLISPVTGSIPRSVYTWVVEKSALQTYGSLRLVDGYKSGSYEGLGTVDITTTSATINNAKWANTDYKSESILRISFK